MKNKSILIVMLILMLSVSAVFAQPAPNSNTADTTSYGFRENQDRYLSVLYFPELLNPVLFLQFDNPAMSTSAFEIGGGLFLSALYIGAYYGGYHYVRGLLDPPAFSNNDSIVQTVDSTLLVDGNNLITGKLETLTINEEYINYYQDDVRALVGLKIGDMHLGIYNQFRAYNNKMFGLYNPVYTFPVGAAWNTPAVDSSTSQTTTVNTQEDADGNIEWFDSTEYALGETGTSYIDDTLSAGLSMGLGSMQLLAYLDLFFRIYNYDDTAFVESYETRIDSGYPAYTPATALPGNTAAEIADCLAYNYTEALLGNSYIYLNPSLGALVEMPLAIWSYPTTFIGGLGLDFGTPLYSNRYTDLTGEEASVSGQADSYSEIDYVSTGGVISEITETTAYETREISNISIGVEPEAGIVVEPEARFRFSFAYQPRLSFFSNTTTYAGSAREVYTYEDGDGVNGNLPDNDDPDDYVETITTTYGGRSETTQGFYFGNTVRTGAQIYLVPEKLRLNLGGTLYHTAIDQETTTVLTPGITTSQTTLSTNGADPVETAYSSDTAVTEDQSETVNNYGYSYITYSLGLTWFISEVVNMDFELDNNAGNYDIWDIQNWEFEININIK